MIGFRFTFAWMMWSVPAFMLGIMGVGWLLMRLFTAGPPSVREGWITGVVGRMGQGKSLYVMTLAKRHLETGGTVISNFRIADPLKGDWIEFRGWVPLLEVLVTRLENAPRDEGGRPRVQPALVLLDEAHLYAPANREVLPEVARWVLSHLRKLRSEMMWCTQHEARVASALREQTSEIVSVRRGQIRPRHFSASHWEPEKFRKPAADCLFKVQYSLKPSVLRLYRSWELIRPDVHGDSAGVVSALIERMELALTVPTGDAENVDVIGDAANPSEVDGIVSKSGGSSYVPAYTD